MKTTVLKPPHEYTPGKRSTTVFLAGSIEMNRAEMWQEDVTQFISSADIKNEKSDEVVVCNPRRDDWNSEWKQTEEDPNFVRQVEWELEHIEKADIVAFYLQPGTNSPISLLELGIVGKDSFATQKRVVVLCPEGFHRKGNVDITAQWFDMHIARDMDHFKQIIKQFIEEHNPFHHEEMVALTERLNKLK